MLGISLFNFLLKLLPWFCPLVILSLLLGQDHDRPVFCGVSFSCPAPLLSSFCHYCFICVTCCQCLCLHIWSTCVCCPVAVHCFTCHATLWVPPFLTKLWSCNILFLYSLMPSLSLALLVFISPTNVVCPLRVLLSVIHKRCVIAYCLHLGSSAMHIAFHSFTSFHHYIE